MKWLLALLCLTTSALAENVGFVKASGTRFVLNGSPYYFAGANYWQGMNLGMAELNGGDRARLRRELDRLKSLGVVNLRVMAASEGPDTEPYRMIPSLQPSAGVFNESVFQGLDYLLSEMNARGMRAVMQLNNYWHWSGGMAQYVSWAEGSNIPYPPSHPQFTGSWWTYMLYASRFYDNPQCQSDFQSYIRTIVERTNTCTGVKYKDDATIFSWELANEPRLYPVEWIDATAAYIKSLDTHHMVTTGSEGDAGGDFIATHVGTNIDYATCHIWPQNWGWYEPYDPSTYEYAIQNALNYLAAHADRSEALNKPLVLEEFGLARDDGSFDPEYEVTFRDAFFAEMYAAVTASAISGGSLAGDCFWAWAGEGRPGDPDGMTGDPPHETPGWYSVYDTDSSTLSVLSNHAAQLALLSNDSDRDSMPDTWEVRHFGGTTNTAGESADDWDHDGVPDLHEYIAGTSPVNDSDYLAIRSIVITSNSAQAHITWNSETGRVYNVSVATNLYEPFTPMAGLVDGTGGMTTYTKNIEVNRTMFFRVRVAIP